MSQFVGRVGRRVIFFTDHALDRWWERCRANHVSGRKAAMDLLREQLAGAVWHYKEPSWAYLSLWHRARCEGHIALDDQSAFIVNRNATGDLVAVSYIEQGEAQAA